MNYLEIASEQIRRDEGMRPYAYQDSEGYWTIGIGRLIDKRKGGGLTEEEVAFLFENDLDEAVNDAKALVPSFDSLSETRKAVLVNMSFNMGRERLSEFKRMLAAVNEGRFRDAGAEMLNSVWAQQVSDRAVRLAQQMSEETTP